MKSNLGQAKNSKLVAFLGLLLVSPTVVLADEAVEAEESLGVLVNAISIETTHVSLSTFRIVINKMKTLPGVYLSKMR